MSIRVSGEGGSEREVLMDSKFIITIFDVWCTLYFRIAPSVATYHYMYMYTCHACASGLKVSCCCWISSQPTRQWRRRKKKVNTCLTKSLAQFHSGPYREEEFYCWRGHGLSPPRQEEEG